MLTELFILSLAAAIGPLIILFNLPMGLRLLLLRHLMIPDLSIAVLLFWAHWGTFSGMAMATLGSLVASGVLRIVRMHYIR